MIIVQNWMSLLVGSFIVLYALGMVRGVLPLILLIILGIGLIVFSLEF